MGNITTEVNHYNIDGRLTCVVTTYENGSFLCDSRYDVTNEVSKAFEGITAG